MEAKEAKKKVRLELPATTHRALKVRAARENTTMRQLMAEALIQFVEPDFQHGLQDGVALPPSTPAQGDRDAHE